MLTPILITIVITTQITHSAAMYLNKRASHIRLLYEAMHRTVTSAGFVRYLILAMECGTIQ